MKKLLSILCLALLGLCLAWPAQAKVYIDITKPSSRKLPLAMPEFRPLANSGSQSLGGEGNRILRGDLELTGLFDILDPKTYLSTAAGTINPREWRRVGAELLVNVEYTLSGSSLGMECKLHDVTDGKLLVGRRYDGLPGDLPAMMHRFADEIMEAITGQKSIFSTQIAFVRSDGGKKEVWLMDFDGTHARQLTNRGDLTLFPSWSPDGKLLAYTTYVNRRPTVALHALAGGSGQVILDKPGVNLTPAFRNDGRIAVALSFSGKTNIYLCDQAGNVGQNLTDGWGIEVAPSFSPDGRQMAFVSDRSGNPQIYVRDMNSGQIRRITYGHKYCAAPDWSPKGDRIAFQAQVDGVFQIATIRPDGGDQQVLTGGYGGGEDPSWSPDGRLIAYSSKAGGRWQIQVMTADGRPVRKFSELSGDCSDPAWSPRGVIGTR